jgi:hypothetical protein
MNHRLRFDGVKTVQMREASAAYTFCIGKRSAKADGRFSRHPEGVALLADEGVALRSKPQGLRPRAPAPRPKSLTSNPIHGS